MSVEVFHSTTPKRIIARLDIKNGKVVKGIMMEGVQAVGDPIELSKKYYAQGADEIILLDTVASLYKRLELPDIITQIVKDVFIPVCAGGGITSVMDADKLFYSGADKICINTAAIKTPKLLKELSKEFGSQSLTLQIDARNMNGTYKVFYNTGRDLSELEVSEWIKIAQDHGIGELLITSIEKDGTGRGADLPLIDLVEKHAEVPVLYGGGISSTDHVNSIFTHQYVSGIVLASHLHFGNNDISDLKRKLATHGHSMREDAFE